MRSLKSNISKTTLKINMDDQSCEFKIRNFAIFFLFFPSCIYSRHKVVGEKQQQIECVE